MTKLLISLCSEVRARCSVTALVEEMPVPYTRNRVIRTVKLRVEYLVLTESILIVARLECVPALSLCAGADRCSLCEVLGSALLRSKGDAKNEKYTNLSEPRCPQGIIFYSLSFRDLR